jgi:hypothetical protein
MDWNDLLSGDTERLSAGGKYSKVRCLVKERIRQDGAGVEQVFAIVQDEEKTLATDMVDKTGHRPSAGFVTETERGHDSSGDKLGVG